MKPSNLSKKIIPQPLQLLDNIGILMLFLMVPAIILGRGVMEGVVGIAVIAFIIRSFVAQDFSWAKESWFVLCLGIWFYLVTVSLTVDHEFNDAIKRTLPWIRLPIFAVAMAHAFLDRSYVRQRLSIWTLVVLNIVAFDAIWQFFTGTSLSGHVQNNPSRLTGPFDEVIVGIYTTHLFFLAIPPVMVMASSIEHFWKKLVAIVVFAALPAACVILSGERMALMLMGLCGLIMLFSLRSFRRELLTCALIAVVFAGGSLATSEKLQKRFLVQTTRQVTNFENSAYGRVYKNAYKVWTQNPVFGVGPRQFRHACQEQKLLALNEKTKYTCGIHTHNIYLEWLVETGILGLSFFFGLIMLWLSRFWTTLKDTTLMRENIELKLSWLAVLTYLWPIMSSMSFFSNWNAIGFWFVLGWALSTCLPQRVYDDLRS